MPATPGPPPPGKKTKKEKRRERKAAEAQTAAAAATSGLLKRKGEGSEDRLAKAAKTEAAVSAGRRVFVGHCPQSLTEEALQKLFASCGQCEVELLRRPNGRFKGIAFATFETTQAAAKALKLTGAELDGKSMVVQLAAAPTESKASPSAERTVAPSPSVYVVGLGPAADKAAVKAALREFGKITGVRMTATGEGKVAFVDFESTEEAAKAVAAKTLARPPPVLGSLGNSVPHISFSLPRKDAAATPSDAAVPSHGSKGRSQAAKIRRRDKRDEQRGIVRPPKGEHGEEARQEAKPKGSGLLLNGGGASEFAPPASISTAKKTGGVGKPSSGKVRANSTKRAKWRAKAAQGEGTKV